MCKMIGLIFAAKQSWNGEYQWKKIGHFNFVFFRFPDLETFEKQLEKEENGMGQREYYKFGKQSVKSYERKEFWEAVGRGEQHQHGCNREIRLWKPRREEEKWHWTFERGKQMVQDPRPDAWWRNAPCSNNLSFEKDGYEKRWLLEVNWRFVKKDNAVDLTVLLQNSYTEALTTHMTVLGIRPLQRWLTVTWGHEVEP